VEEGRVLKEKGGKEGKEGGRLNGLREREREDLVNELKAGLGVM
jgi:hypothetical protein